MSIDILLCTIQAIIGASELIHIVWDNEPQYFAYYMLLGLDRVYFCSVLMQVPSLMQCNTIRGSLDLWFFRNLHGIVSFLIYTPSL